VHIVVGCAKINFKKFFFFNMNSEIIVQRHPIIWEEKVKSFWCDIIIIGSHYEFDVTNHLHAENSTMEANISSFFINLFIEEKSNEFITIFFGVIPFNDKKIYIYLLMQACLQIISMQIRSKKGRTISFQWCMEISTQRLLKHSTAQHTWSINIKVSEFQSSKAPTTHSEYCV
jgi:hypothetical protein